MYLTNNLALEAQNKRSQMLKDAEQQRLAIIAQGGQRRFRFLSWRLPDFRRQPVTLQPEVSPQCEVTRKPASNPM